MKYRKKPVIIEAIQYNGNNIKEIINFVGESIDVIDTWVFIKTLEGNMTVDVGDFVIRGIKGEFYPCKPDIFEATYEKVMED